MRLIGVASRDPETRRRADRRQGFAAEAERADGDKIVVGELRCGMPLHRKRQIGAGHAVTVVGDADQPAAAPVGENIDALRPSIERVLHKFLDHARRAFDDLPGSNAVDDGFAELANRHDRRFHLRFAANGSPDRALRLCCQRLPCGAMWRGHVPTSYRSAARECRSSEKPVDSRLLLYQHVNTGRDKVKLTDSRVAALVRSVDKNDYVVMGRRFAGLRGSPARRLQTLDREISRWSAATSRNSRRHSQGTG